MPTPEFIPLPEFVRFHCANTDEDRCATCPRDFTVQLSAIEAIWKNPGGKAAILMRTIHYFPTPFCGRKTQVIETTINYSDVIALLNGKIVDMGNINMNPDYSIQVN